MGTLWFVGLGLFDERGLSDRALEVLRTADRVFAEEYTAVSPPGTLDRLAERIGRPIERLGRADVESERPLLDALARSPRVVLLVVGDPFGATTHVALRLAAERAGHGWEYVPNASILTAAAGFLGLIHYRFGRTVSLPFEEPGFTPRSPLEQVRANRDRGLHTLLLLDLRPDDGRYLTASQALARLGSGAGALPDDTPVAVAARVGSPTATGWYGPLGRLRKIDFGPPLHVVVVLAEPHFEEAAALERYRVRDDPSTSGPPAG